MIIEIEQMGVIGIIWIVRYIMMSQVKLRCYQQRAIDETLAFIRAGKGNPVIAAPTGVGKALLLAGLIKQLLFEFPRLRVVVVTHVKELVEQDYNELERLWSTAPSSIYSAGLGKKDVSQITFCGIGSIANNADLLGKVDLVIVDEAHSISGNETTTYVKFIKALEAKNKYLKVVGLSATCYRLGHGLITENHPIFDGFSIDLTSFHEFNWFIEQGYLATLTSKRTKSQLDVTGVKITAGDYNSKQLAQAVDKIEVTREALKEAVMYGQDRNCWICFATSIDHVIHITDMLNDEFNIPSVAVHSKMTGEERDTAIQDFKDGKYRCAVNAMVLTTGTNIPQIDMVIDLAPTTSTARYIQRYGRATRPVYAQGYDLSTKEGRLEAISAGIKPHGALCLDFSGTIARLGMINDPVIPKKKSEGKGGNPPIKTCIYCQTISHPSVRVCPECGHDFPFEVKITHTASTQDIIAKEPRTKIINHEIEDEWYEVYDVRYSKHIIRKTGIPMLRVEYNSATLGATEWVGFENPLGSPQRGMAYGWWSKRVIGKCPKSIDEAMAYVAQLPKPTEILVSQKGKYLNVKKVKFADGFIPENVDEIIIDMKSASEFTESDIPF